MTACPRCQGDNPAAARFCMHCGQALRVPDSTPQAALAQHAPQHGEHRIVSVLFLDIASSTRLSAVLGAEPWHHLLSEFFASVSKVIERSGGVVNQYTGDGLMALFGAPRALEDHALRACHAAWECQQRIQPLADRVRLQNGLNFGVRAGLNTGPVVVGAIADDWSRDYTAQGATVHLAARMEQMAQPGSVYLAESTARLVDGYFALRSIGPTQVAGVEHPVQVAELVGVGPLRQRLDRSRHMGLSPFVGRAELVAALTGARAQAQSGSSQLLALRGDAGLGKSRLCLEMIERWRHAEPKQLVVLQCAAVSYGDAQPLAPIRAMLRQLFGVPPGADAEAARRAVAGSVALDYPEWREMLSTLFEFLQIAAATAGPIAPDARQRQQDALQAQLCRSLCRTDLVLWIDDWQWLDDASQQYLQAWVTHLLQDARALVLVTLRPQTLPDWMQAAGGTVLDLQPLDTRAMAQLAERLASPEFAAAPLGQRVIAHAEGNPFFIEESISHLLDKGVLAGPAGSRQLCSQPESLHLPDTVQALLAARLDTLAPVDRKWLEAAALVGREFAPDWVAATLAEDLTAVRDALFRLADSGFLEPPQGQADWRFSHGLLQEEAVRRQLDSVRRRRWQQLASWLSAQIEAGDQDPLQWLRVADYRERSGDLAAAAEANLRGSRALGRLQLQDSMRATRRALTQAEALPEGAEREALRFRIHASLLRGASFGLESAADVDRWSQEAEAYLEHSPDPRGQVELWMSAGALALNQGDVRGAYLRSRRAFALAVQLNDTALIARFRVPFLFAHLMRGHLRGGLALLDDLDAGAWRNGPPDLENFLSRGFYAVMLAAAGQPESGITELRAVTRFAEDIGAPVSWMYGFLAELQLPTQPIDGVLPLAQRGVEVAQAFGSPAFDEIANRALAQVLAANGEANEAYALLQHWTPQVQPGSPGAVFASAHHECLGRLALLAGQAEAASQALDHAIRLARTQGQLYWLARALQTRSSLFPEAAHSRRDRLWLDRLISLTGAASLRGPSGLPGSQMRR